MNSTKNFVKFKFDLGAIRIMVEASPVLECIGNDDWTFIFQSCRTLVWQDLSNFSDRATAEFLNEL